MSRSLLISSNLPWRILDNIWGHCHVLQRSIMYVTLQSFALRNGNSSIHVVILGANENRPLIRNAPPKLGIGITLSKELPLPTNEIHGIFVQGIIKIPMMAQFTVHCVGTSYTTAYKACLNFIFKLSQQCALYKKMHIVLLSFILENNDLMS